MPTQRLVRRRPISERILSHLDPLDLCLRLSEEIQTFDWDSKTFGIRAGLALNFLFLLVRANSGASSQNDDVFSDAGDRSWGSFFVHPLLWILIIISCTNAYFTMTRSRHYRLFESNVEQAGPSTPSAHRVRVDSSPASSSPLRVIQDVMATESAEARAHPDKTRDVWEMAVWDPYPATLQILCLFSPGHVLLHMLFLPMPPLDPRPSVTIFKCVVLQVIVSTQLLLLQSRFTQQIKDTAIIQKEVLHEYDIKYVHPRLHPVVREVGIQINIGEDGIEDEAVGVGTPATLIRRGFQTNPNPNYSKYFDPDNSRSSSQLSRSVLSPTLFTPQAKPRAPALRQSMGSPSTRASAGGLAKETSSSGHGTGSGHGGSLGYFSHIKSPLKKATSIGELNQGVVFSPRNGREMAALEQRELTERLIRQQSPVKENRRATDFANKSTHPFAATRPNRYSGERFPSRF